MLPSARGFSVSDTGSSGGEGVRAQQMACMESAIYILKLQSVNVHHLPRWYFVLLLVKIKASVSIMQRSAGVRSVCVCVWGGGGGVKKEKRKKKAGKEGGGGGGGEEEWEGT